MLLTLQLVVCKGVQGLGLAVRSGLASTDNVSRLKATPTLLLGIQPHCMARSHGVCMCPQKNSAGILSKLVRLIDCLHLMVLIVAHQRCWIWILTQHPRYTHHQRIEQSLAQTQNYLQNLGFAVCREDPSASNTAFCQARSTRDLVNGCQNQPLCTASVLAR